MCRGTLFYDICGCGQWSLNSILFWNKGVIYSSGVEMLLDKHLGKLAWRQYIYLLDIYISPIWSKCWTPCFKQQRRSCTNRYVQPRGLFNELVRYQPVCSAWNCHMQLNNLWFYSSCQLGELHHQSPFFEVQKLCQSSRKHHIMILQQQQQKD